ncbi:MAG: FlgO family outer membrane protein [Elusimicrobiota bacterium]|nr:FlgO family outer membrane protein [Elusimicrobiota bacterium]
MIVIIMFAILFTPMLVKAAPPPNVKQQTLQAESAKKPNAYRPIANELLENCEGADKKIAVAGFSYSDGRDSRDGGVVAERITTELVKLKKIKIIERKEIEKVFEELKLQRSGAIDSDSVKDIGKMLGADWVVVGTLTELPDKQLELNARIVGVESGEIINATSAHLKKDWLDQYRKMLVEQNKAINKNSKDAQAFYEKGRVYFDLAEVDNAIASFSMAISLNQTYLEAYLSRGWVYAIIGEYDKAIEDCSKAIAINPKHAKAYVDRGNSYYSKGDYESAFEDFSKAITIDPKYTAAYSSRGVAYYSQGEYEKAIEEYSKAITIDLKDTAAYSSRASAYQKKGDYENAIRDYSEVIAINPKDESAYLFRGEVYFYKTGEYVKAIEDFSKAIAISPKGSLAYGSRAEAYRKIGENEKAAADEKTLNDEEERVRAAHLKK